MKSLKRLLLSLFAVAAFASVAHAAEPAYTSVLFTGEAKPLLSAERLSLAVGANYAFFSAPLESSARLPEFKKEFEAGVFAAYNLTPHLSAVGSSVYGLDNKQFRTSVGLRVRIFQGAK